MNKPSRKTNEAVNCPICQSNIEELATANVQQNQSNPWVIVRVIQKRYIVGRFPNQPEAQVQLRFLKRTIPDAEFEVVDERTPS